MRSSRSPSRRPARSGTNWRARRAELKSAQSPPHSFQATVARPHAGMPDVALLVTLERRFQLKISLIEGFQRHSRLSTFGAHGYRAMLVSGAALINQSATSPIAARLGTVGSMLVNTIAPTWVTGSNSI